MHIDIEALLSTVIIMETRPFGFGLEAMMTLMKEMKRENKLKGFTRPRSEY